MYLMCTYMQMYMYIIYVRAHMLGYCCACERLTCISHGQIIHLRHSSFWIVLFIVATHIITHFLFTFLVV